MKTNKKMNILAISLMIVLILPLNVFAANFVLQDQGTDAKHKATKELIDFGDLEINIYDNATGGNLIYTETFIDVINDGFWSVKLGTNPSNPLTLNYGTPYWKDYRINGEDVDFYDNYGNLIERDLFYSPFGEIDTSWITSGILDWARIPTIHDTNITDTGKYILSTSDIYLKNTGDTATGNYIFDINTLKIDADNNRIGIGLLTPIYKLHVNGSLYADSIDTFGNINASTINTGHGNNELYAMNQNVRTIDSPEFAGLKIGGVLVNEFSNDTSLSDSSISAVPTENAVKAYVDNKFLSAGTISGSGTSNYLTKWTAGTTIGDSLIYENGGNIGIGTTTPSATLDVNGSLILQEGVSINKISNDTTLSGNSDSAVPTEKAVKSYVDGARITQSTSSPPETASVGDLWFDGLYLYLYSDILSSWDISTASYDNESFLVESQETQPSGLFFKPDGTKFYALGPSSDTVHQYSLGTAWEISTASYDSKSFSVASQASFPVALFFKPDGTKFYVTGSYTVYQYSLGTAWDISTASYDNKSFSTFSQELTSRGLFFKPDGTKVYIVGYNSKSIYQYSLGTAWEISTASYDSKSFSVASQDEDPRGLFFKPDGTKVYMVGYNSKSIYQYSLGTAWDISTASYDNKSFSVTSQYFNPMDLFFKPDGTKVYLAGPGQYNIYQYSLSLTEGWVKFKAV